MNYDVVALGEYLIDFTPYGRSKAGQPLFERNPGGAPVNVVAALAKLGKKTGFIGKVGNDPFGVYLRDALLHVGVSDKGLVATEEAHTTMAFVQLDSDGDRSFHFARNPGADQLLRADELNLSMLAETRIFHFGSISMTTEPAYTATLKAVQVAKECGALITYDPNWRPSLWRDEEHALEVIHVGLSLADVVKVSEEELFFLTDEQDLEKAARHLVEQYGLTLLLVTAGGAGSFYQMKDWWGKMESFHVQTVDTTGAGDAFFGALLFEVLDLGKPLQVWQEEDLQEVLRFANAAGALATTRKGAIPSLGTLEEIHALVINGNNYK
ncbi:PfkB family carbohydrate kinase [Paenibacillus sp. HWE-109]|uniref:PfkB family carbohydrate kinase n=1 Tax=Paenibacillus sp. HWE-109 TaxID=1306526 RepID=UPI001EDDC796|nr:PfkB family carbohydrate kinase [Paenibacillus sp. HWE-109]UKS27888.1 PfkB family carbohydrate kinase [Paenibacillus sp. HWE-109]